ncbi:MAG: adenylate cyclase [Kiritimatiellae bacterium]|nr:adenylate cyclase [Kiritimatiellia bacterium]
MPVEIERKFVARPTAVPMRARPLRIRQVYLWLKSGGIARVRMAGGRAWLAVKRDRRGPARTEIEAEIPVELGRELLGLAAASAPVVKRRYRRRYRGRQWEVDVFEGANRGLILAEVELRRASDAVALPPWVVREVTLDPRFANVSLAVRPFGQWPAAERRAVLGDAVTRPPPPG